LTKLIPHLNHSCPQADTTGGGGGKLKSGHGLRGLL
jgi:hypothetical protein